MDDRRAAAPGSSEPHYHLRHHASRKARLHAVPFRGALTLVLASVAAACTTSRPPSVTPTVAQPERVIIGYVFPRGAPVEAAALDASKLTHVNYAFANVIDGTVVEGTPHDARSFRALVDLRRLHPHLKVLVSVGGWSWSGGFSDAALTDASRARFVESAVAFVRRHDLDGFDVDWEYPGLPGAGNTHRPEDKENFTEMMSGLRFALDAAGRAGGRRYLLTMAAGASRRFLEHTEMDKVSAVTDFVNLMTYDFRVAAANTLAGHHANLYASPADPDGHSADAAVRAFLEAGVPAARLVLGVPFYGRTWVDVVDVPPANGLYRRGNAPTERFDARYGALADRVIGRDGYERFWDADARAPFLWNASTRTFITYEDPESLREKCRYIQAHGLAGAMFWEYFADPTGALLGTLHTGLRDLAPGS